jgi:exodeoxyribonuclease VII large subunit
MSDLFVDDSNLFQGKVNEILTQIKWIITHRKSEFVGKLLTLQTHKSVAIRRKIAEGLSQLGGKDNIETLQTWQSNESDRETWIILESSIDKLNRGIGDTGENEEVVFTVSEALQYVKNLLGTRELVIEGELSEVKLTYQMYYFGIKDTDGSRIDCGCFSGLVARFGFPLNDGLSVRITGVFKLGKSSRLYFDVKSMKLTGEGELLRNLKLLEDKLTAEGLLDESRKRSIPLLPRTIILLASNASAALTDFQKVLQARRGGIQIIHIPIKTQGQDVEVELLEKLAFTAKESHTLNADTIVITRGGGSMDDLAIFNSERVVRAIHGLPLPTIVAIGHERDITLSELVADKRASTPSNAAEFASLSRDEVVSQINHIESQLKSFFNQKQYQYNQVTQQLVYRIEKDLTQRIQMYRNMCESVFITFREHLRYVRQNMPSVEKMTFGLRSNLQVVLMKTNSTINAINLYDSKKVLSLGYSIVTDASGDIVESVSTVEIGAVLKMKLIDGDVLSTTTSIEVSTSLG